VLLPFLRAVIALLIVAALLPVKASTVLRPGFETLGWAYSGSQF
jgi:hypothetical protein